MTFRKSQAISIQQLPVFLALHHQPQPFVHKRSIPRPTVSMSSAKRRYSTWKILTFGTAIGPSWINFTGFFLEFWVHLEYPNLELPKAPAFWNSEPSLFTTSTWISNSWTVVASFSSVGAVFTSSTARVPQKERTGGTNSAMWKFGEKDKKPAVRVCKYIYIHTKCFWWCHIANVELVRHSTPRAKQRSFSQEFMGPSRAKVLWPCI